jgi:Domain of unknown function (DUF4386)
LACFVVTLQTALYSSQPENEIINQMFWGLWLLPFGSLVLKSRFLPRRLGYWLLFDGLAWVFISVTWFLAPDHSDALFRYFQPAFMGELAAADALAAHHGRAKEKPLIAAERL